MSSLLSALHMMQASSPVNDAKGFNTPRARSPITVIDSRLAYDSHSNSLARDENCNSENCRQSTDIFLISVKLLKSR